MNALLCALGSLAQLQYLDIGRQHQYAPHQDPSVGLRKLPTSLQGLVLHWTHINSLDWATRLTNLGLLDLRACGVQSADLAQLAGLTRLEQLYLDKCGCVSSPLLLSLFYALKYTLVLQA
jgi:hypothetical protein